MATAYKILGQSNPAATTSTDLYTVGAGKSTIVSTITVCNQAATDATFRLSVAEAGVAISGKQYITYDTTVRGNGFVTLTLGITLDATDKIRVYASSARLCFLSLTSVS